MLNMMSNLDNLANKKMLAADFQQIITQLHTAILELATNDKELVELKEDFSFSVGMPMATIGQFVQVAKFTGRMWELADKIMLGDCKPFVSSKGSNQKKKKKAVFKKPTSCSCFVKLGGVPNELAIKWMEDVVEGRSSLASIGHRADAFKAERRVKRAIVERIQLKHGSFDDQLVNRQGKALSKTALVEKYDELWDQVKVMFPGVFAPAFWESWVGPVARLKQKDDLPAAFLEALDAQITVNQVCMSIV